MIVAHREIEVPLSIASSPSFHSHSTPLSIQEEEESQSNSNLAGLGLGPVQDLSYLVGATQDGTSESGRLQIKLSNSSRLLKRRKRKESRASDRGDKPFRCPHCSYSFDRKCNLTCHLKVHGVGRGRVTCPEPGCGKEYGRRADVNRHIRTVSITMFAP